MTWRAKKQVYVDIVLIADDSTSEELVCRRLAYIAIT